MKGWGGAFEKAVRPTRPIAPLGALRDVARPGAGIPDGSDVTQASMNPSHPRIDGRVGLHLDQIHLDGSHMRIMMVVMVSNP